ncbi:MAG: DUF3307 domain-containing protein [Paludibacter sp.]|nr:DUF3307 domain-containing protein [Paludibacter sp.]
MIKTLVVIFILHVFAGFFLQSNRISKLKRENKRYLLEHVGLYTLVFIILSPVLLGLTILQGLVYSLINGVLHLVVDYFTGKLKVKLIDKNEVKYNLTIAMDYTIHLVILVSTYFYLYPDAYKALTFWERG